MDDTNTTVKHTTVWTILILLLNTLLFGKSTVRLDTQYIQKEQHTIDILCSSDISPEIRVYSCINRSSRRKHNIIVQTEKRRQ